MVDPLAPPDRRRVRARAPSRFAGSIPAIAEWFGVTGATVTAWSREPTFPPWRAEGYDLLDTARWEAARAKRNNAPTIPGDVGGDTDGISRDEAERRIKVHAAAKAKIELDTLKGSMIPKRDHEDMLGSLVESFVSALENLPPRVVPMLAAARGREEVDQILRDQIRLIRIQLAAKHAPDA